MNILLIILLLVVAGIVIVNGMAQKDRQDYILLEEFVDSCTLTQENYEYAMGELSRLRDRGLTPEEDILARDMFIKSRFV